MREKRNRFIPRLNSTCLSLYSPGDLVLLVQPLHSAVRLRCRHRAVRGGQQRHLTPAADAEAGGRSVLHLLPRQQICQLVDLRVVPPEHTVLPHLVHPHQLLLAGTQRVLSALPDGDEHHDSDLFLPTAPRRHLLCEEKLREAERDAQQQEVPERLTETSQWTTLFFKQVGKWHIFVLVQIIFFRCWSVASHCQTSANTRCCRRFE